MFPDVTSVCFADGVVVAYFGYGKLYYLRTCGLHFILLKYMGIAAFKLKCVNMLRVFTCYVVLGRHSKPLSGVTT